ncbi:uncharacterized protein [Haliotis asinina]|uniref:uncharacterized protein n=1 Tax=Haliotis asinina TaxID=109174 RepID=UPI003531985F
MITLVIAGVVGIYCIKWILTPEPPVKCGIYVQPNKWYPLKYLVFRVLLWMRKRQNQNRKNASGEDAGYGMRSRSSPEDMDKVQILPPEHPKAVDAVYFNGGNKEGYFIVTATARRHKNLVQTIVLLRVPGVGLLMLPSMPDTSLTGPGDSYSAGGLTMEVLEPMKTWRVAFQGKLRLSETGEEKTVSFDLKWTAITNFFDFDTDLDPSTTADAIAREKWSRGYFENLKTVHQTHYEQFGELVGDVCIEGLEPRTFRVKGVRDHSYGNIRDWKYFHRYGLQYGYFGDGTCLCVGAICMPMCMSRLTVGYMFLKDGTLVPVSHTDFEFFNHGEDQNPPKQMTLGFTAGGKKYELFIDVVQCPVFYMGEEWDAKIFERLCNFRLNGVEGWGISEWDYRNYAGKEGEMKKLKASS